MLYYFIHPYSSTLVVHRNKTFGITVCASIGTLATYLRKPLEPSWQTSKNETSRKILNKGEREREEKKTRRRYYKRIQKKNKTEKDHVNNDVQRFMSRFPIMNHDGIKTRELELVGNVSTNKF